jgi:hypothetical protein
MWKIKTLFLEKRKRKKKKEVVLSEVCCRAWVLFIFYFPCFRLSEKLPPFFAFPNQLGVRTEKPWLDFSGSDYDRAVELDFFD